MFIQLILLSSRRVQLPVLLGLSCFFSAVANAATIEWQSTTGGDYHDGGNWVGGDPPGADDTASFAVGETFEVTFEDAGGFSNMRLLVNDGNVTFDLDGKTLNVTDPSTPSHDSVQPFTISGGTTSSGPAVTVVNGTLNITTRGTIGRNNESGALTIGSGGSVVAGNDFLAGQRGTGQLLVENGGSFSAGRFFVGHRNGGDGTAIFTGATTTGSWSGGLLTIGGEDASGELRVLNGAVLTGSGTGSTSAVNVGVHADSISASILVSGAGSRLTHVRHMTIGNTSGVGTGTVTVTAGGRIEMGGDGIDLRAGNLFTGDGSVRVTAASGVFTNAGILRPGLLDSEGGFTGGVLNLERAYIQTATGVLNINLGGTAEGDFGAVEFSDGAATLGGILDVVLRNDFELGFDQFFHVVRLGTGGSMSGQFIGLDENELVGTFNGVNLYITYDPEAFGAASGGVGLYSVIPEPRTYALLFGALVAAVAVLRRRK